MLEVSIFDPSNLTKNHRTNLAHNKRYNKNIYDEMQLKLKTYSISSKRAIIYIKKYHIKICQMWRSGFIR